MIVTPINDYEIVKKLRSKYIIRIYFDRKWKEYDCFYLSEKQFINLTKSINIIRYSNVKNSRVLIVLDDNRYVWSGIDFKDYSDQNWLMNTFHAEFVEYYVVNHQESTATHMPDKIVNTEIKHDTSLIRSSD